jgi:hypothetical protein
MFKSITIFAKKQPHTFLSQIGLNGHVCFTCQSPWKLVTLHLDLCYVHGCRLCQQIFSILSDQKTPNTLFGSGEAPNKIDFQEDLAKEVLKMAQKFKSWASAVSHKQCGHI